MPPILVKKQHRLDYVTNRIPLSERLGLAHHIKISFMLEKKRKQRTLFIILSSSKNLMSECQPRQKIPNFLHWGKKTIMSQLISKYHRKLRHYSNSLQSVIDAKLHTDIKYQTKCLKRNYSTKKNEIIDRDALVPSWLLAGSSLRTIVSILILRDCQ